MGTLVRGQSSPNVVRHVEVARSIARDYATVLHHRMEVHNVLVCQMKRKYAILMLVLVSEINTHIIFVKYILHHLE